MAQQRGPERDPVDLLRYVDDLRHALTERVSHELRTPLTIVLGVAETIHRQSDVIAPDQLRLLTSRLQAQGHRLEGLLDDLIDLDRLARSILAPVRTPVDVVELATRAAESVGLDGRRLDLRVEPVIAEVDAARVARLVENLIANVRRHTPPGTSAYLRVAPTEGGVLIEVGDDGPGLDDDVRSDAFEPFVQGRLRHPETPGLGIGLSLVRRIAELHGGRAWLGDGPGCVVRVLLPTYAPPVPSTRPATRRPRRLVTEHRSELTAVRLLDPAIVSILETLRQSAGVPVVYLTEFAEHHQVTLAVAGDGASVGLVAGSEVPLADAFCVQMAEGRIPSVIPDVADEPSVGRLRIVHPRIMAYCGVPVRLPDGSLFGSLCAVGDDAATAGIGDESLRLLANGAELLAHHMAGFRGRLVEADGRARRVEEVLLRGGVTSELQPIVDLMTGRVVGVESLARFPDARVRPPSAWFADAERVGLGRELERAALTAAADQLTLVPDGAFLSCNASPALILSGWLDTLAERIPPERLVIEITEHAVVSDHIRLEGALAELRGRGARLAVDDVGAGFTAFRHVLDLGPDVVKVDRGLVGGVGNSPGKAAILRGLVVCSEQIGAQVVAAGIETVQDLDVVRAGGIELGQGFLLCRPRASPVPSEIDVQSLVTTN